MLACGVPLSVVKEILNYAKIQTTMRYSYNSNILTNLVLQ